MRRKKANLHDEPEAPVGIPDRRPKTGKRSCEACAVVGPKATVQLCLRRTGKPPGKFMGNPTEVCTLMRGLETADRESFYALHLDAREQIVDIAKIAVGELTNVSVHPREVFKGAILGNAASIVLVHNHPSSDPTPSPQDIELTKKLQEIGELHRIPIKDHVIVGGSQCVSFLDRGLITRKPR